jgi:type III restriction enzyme
VGQLPVQAVDEPILSSPYDEPQQHWIYRDGIPERAGGRRPASYYATTRKVGAKQGELFAEETRDTLPLVNRLREDVRRWREAKWRGASQTTRDLLAHWAARDRARRLFFCQLEAVETLIYLMELVIPGRLGRTGYKRFELDEENLERLLKGERPSFEELVAGADFFPRLIDVPADGSLLPLRRLGCKMATGSGKTVVMAMLIAWAFCNRGRNPASTEFPSGVLVCAPNLTVKERLQVLRPDVAGNYFDAFNIVPTGLREALNSGRVLVTNWHFFAPRSPGSEGGTSYRVVDKGEETNHAFALNRLGELADRLPILVLNDEGHHCWRPKGAEPDEAAVKGLTGEDKQAVEEEEEEARVWLAGLDRINNSGLIGATRPGVLACVDLSATPFYLAASGYPEGSPFPWLVSDFGLVDAIESGIVKIPRLPVKDDTAAQDEAGRPDPKYFRLWKNIVSTLPPGDRGPGGKPKPEAVYREAEGALLTLAGQWNSKFDQLRAAQPHQEVVPPVLIVVCDNTKIARVFFEKISGETEAEVAVEGGKSEVRKVFGASSVLAEFANSEGRRHTIQIDTRALDAVEAGEGSTKDKAAEELRRIVATVGKRGEPGEHVRCVVSVSMLTEGWDASNVTHVLGVRAFQSQLLCEQVVGRGLRRMNYTPDPKTGYLLPEHVDVYGIPFSLIPFKKQPVEDDGTGDPIRFAIHAVADRASLEMRMPVVEGYVYALREQGLRCDVDDLEGFEVDEEPTQVYLMETRGYIEDPTKLRLEHAGFVKQDRKAFYEQVNFEEVLFRITQRLMDELVQGAEAGAQDRAWVKLRARHTLFPELYRVVSQYVERRVRFKPGVDRRELALEIYVRQIVERLRDGLQGPAAAAEAPLLPVLNSWSPTYSSSSVNYSTIRPVVSLQRSHLNAAAPLSEPEKWAIEAIEESPLVECFTPNDRQIGWSIPYEYDGQSHKYLPDFFVKLKNGKTLILEVKGEGGMVHDANLVAAKNGAAKKWTLAVSNLGEYGAWHYEICHAVEGDSRWSYGIKLRKLLERHGGTGEALPFRRLEDPDPASRFRTCVPILPLRAAAGAFSDEQIQPGLPFEQVTEWAEFDRAGGFSEGMFVARVQGRSMEPRVPDGSWCLFRPAPAGSRQGRLLVVWARGLSGDEGSEYTFKRYTSEKRPAEEGGFVHTNITLHPLNPDFTPIVLTPESEGDVRVIGEFVEVVGRG